MANLGAKKFQVLFSVTTLGIFSVMMYLKGHQVILDEKLFYLKSQIHPILDALGDDGRHMYRIVNVLDFSFIISYSFLFFSFYKAFFKEHAYPLMVVPLLLGFSDFVETGIIWYLLQTYPKVHPHMEFILMLATPTKWFFFLSSVMIFINGYFVKWYLKNQ